MTKTYWVAADDQGEIDMDDLSPKEALEELLSQCGERHQAEDILAGKIYHVDEDGEETGSWRPRDLLGEVV